MKDYALEDPREFADRVIEKANGHNERWFILAACFLRLFAILVSSYLKRDR